MLISSDCIALMVGNCEIIQIVGISYENLLMQLQLVTPHANKVINIWNSRLHNICCSHLEKSPIEHEGR